MPQLNVCGNVTYPFMYGWLQLLIMYIYIQITTYLHALDSLNFYYIDFTAFFYSALCIAMTYLVGNIKAIIPAAFVVFTAIGGPTLSIITLGMLSTTANQKGIIVGLLSGIALNAWIGTGALISDAPQIKLPQSIDSCPVSSLVSDNLTTIAFSAASDPVNTNVTAIPTNIISLLQEEVFPLYRLSFLLHPVPGTILTFVVGFIISFITGGDKDVDENLLCSFVRKKQHINSTQNKMEKEVPNGNNENQQKDSNTVLNNCDNSKHNDSISNGHHRDIVEESQL